jgi:hypothetical protein
MKRMMDSGYRIYLEWRGMSRGFSPESMIMVCSIFKIIGVYQFINQIANNVEIAERAIVSGQLLTQIKGLRYE